MRTKRSMESQDFRKNRTSGHLYAALAMQAGEPMDVGPTVVVKDYPAADDQMGVINQGILKNEKCKELQACGTSGTRSLALLPSTPRHLLIA